MDMVPHKVVLKIHDNILRVIRLLAKLVFGEAWLFLLLKLLTIGMKIPKLAVTLSFTCVFCLFVFIKKKKEIRVCTKCLLCTTCRGTMSLGSGEI